MPDWEQWLGGCLPQGTAPLYISSPVANRRRLTPYNRASVSDRDRLKFPLVGG